MVPEVIIEQIIDRYENDEVAYVEALANIMESQPALLAFLSQESINILLEEEKDVLWYIVLVVYESIDKSDVQIAEITEDTLSENDEKNWTLLQEQPKGTFREKITPFYNDYHHEDLLAFVEDSLEIEDGSPITTVGRDVIFISAKSIIDTILPSK